VLKVGGLVLLWMSALTWVAHPVRAQIPFRSGPVDAQVRMPRELERAMTELADEPARRHIVVQFDRPVGAGHRAALRQSGVELLGYLGDNAFFASMATLGVDASAAAQIDGLVEACAIDRVWKVSPAINASAVPDHAMVDNQNPANPTVAAYVLFHRDVDLTVTGVAVASGHGAAIVAELESVNGLVVELPWDDLNALADEDVVQWIEWPLPPMSVVNDSNRTKTEADTAQAAPYSLDGSGVTVMVYDAGTVLATHVDYASRITVLDSSGTDYHPTHVAGTIGGDGTASGGTYAGMAPNVTMLSYGFQYDGSGTFLYTNPGDLESDYNEAINTYGADISNNSIGTNTESNGFDCAFQGDYGVTAALIDAIVGGSLGEPFRIVWANGNERQGSRCDVEGYGDYYSTAPPAGAKNHITVGAINSNDDSMTSFSSWGPLDDGRMKPDISAPGCQSSDDGGVTSCNSSGDTSYTTLCGTSMAAPTVCGLSALLLEDFRAQFSSEPDPRNSTVKILLAHNAVDLGNTGPDHMYGYGSVRIQQTIDFMRTENFLEDEVGQGNTFSVMVLVGSGDPELKVTIAWDDVPGTPNVHPALVNDLDLRVYDPSSTQYYPWTLDPYAPGDPAVQTQTNHVDNIEQVLVNSPTPGVWRIEVYGYNVPSGPQSFSLCASHELVACSSMGAISLDSSLYACSDTAESSVVDCDLNTSNSMIETVTVTIASDSEPGGESVLLTETGAETADFRGAIALDAVDSAGVLMVANGDTVTATYVDADDGQGGTNVTVTATATVDCTGPMITNVQVSGIGLENATVVFDTDEPATGTVRYGLSCGALTDSVAESDAGTAHSLTLTGLSDGTRYYFAVDAVDEQGTPSTDDNGGSCYSFATLDVVYSFPMDTDPGWTTKGLWAWGQPTGGGGQYGGPDPTSGYTGSYVYGYNVSGDYENRLSETHLTSTAIDCTGLSNVTLRFWRWLGVETPTYDHAYVRVSNNGSIWTTIWQNTGEVTDSSWIVQEFDISVVADDASTLYLRWTMGTTDRSWQYCGWNIDDVQLVALTSTAPPTVTTSSATGITTDSATLNGSLDSLGTASSVDVSFEWGLDTSYGNETTPQSMAATGSFNDGTSGLSPGTTYHYRAKAVGDGTDYGDDMTFTASATLTVNVVGNGSVTLDPGGGTYSNGTVVELNANADPGWTFDSWSGDLNGSANPDSITINGNMSVTSTFTQDEYTLTINAVGNGSVGAEPYQTTYHYGDIVQLTAEADVGWTFSGWSGDLKSGDNPAMLTIDDHMTVTATFEEQPQESIPTLNELGLVIFALLLAMSGMVMIRTRQV